MDLVGEGLVLTWVLHRRLVRRFWSVWLNMFVVSVWCANLSVTARAIGCLSISRGLVG